MAPKDFTVFTPFWFADWGRAFTPSVLFQLSVVQFAILIILIGAVCITLRSSIQPRAALKCCILMALTCQALGMAGTYLSHRRAFEVIAYSETRAKPEELIEGSSYIVAHTIVGGLGMFACIGIGLSTLLRKQLSTTS
jgi:hypothetical protein